VVGLRTGAARPGRAWAARWSAAALDSNPDERHRHRQLDAHTASEEAANYAYADADTYAASAGRYLGDGAEREGKGGGGVTACRAGWR
jgi:hypothetical protein